MEISLVRKLLNRNISSNVYFIVSNQLLQLCTVVKHGNVFCTKTVK